MNVDDSIHILEADITKHIDLLTELYEELGEALEKDVQLLGKTRRSAAMVASIIESYFTCTETIFLRISQFFENNLSEHRWHKDLLEKMTLEIKDIRPKVISADVYNDLHEILRFRHFKRYYFSLAYDWERLEEIIKRAKRVHPELLRHLGGFTDFLQTLLKT